MDQNTIYPKINNYIYTTKNTNL